MYVCFNMFYDYWRYLQYVVFTKVWMELYLTKYPDLILIKKGTVHLTERLK